ncbi:efflux RND transporter periplasmic adaptor subunit [bacterium]|nr:efflux RND transporter periplasmic adaptor subunit [bacterium]
MRVLICLLSILTACTTPPVVKVARVKRATIAETVSSITSGTIEAEQSAELSFGAVGRVKTLNTRIGNLVKRGEILAELENDDLKSQLLITNQELARHENLFKIKAISESALQTIRMQRDLAKGAYEKSQIIAPFDGLIAELNLEVGQLSQITAVIPKPLIRIVDTLPRYVQAEIDEVDISKVKVGMPAKVTILATRREPFEASVRKVINYVTSAKEQDRTSQIELDLAADRQELIPAGASADVEVVIQIHENALVVPVRALLGRANQRYLYILQDSKAQRREVKTGIVNYEYAEILVGLSESDTVIVPSEKDEISDQVTVSVKDEAN